MESAPAYAAPGWLLFTRQGVLAAQPFDAAALRTTGDVVLIGDEPGVAPGPATYDGGRRVSASASGALAFVANPAVNTTAEWRDLSGKPTGTVTVRPGRYSGVVLAPDGTRALLERSEGVSERSWWLVDLARVQAVPLGDSLARTASPIWSADSRQVRFVAIRDGQSVLVERTAGDASPGRVVMRLSPSVIPRAWFKNEMILNRIDPGTKWNVYRAPADGTGEPVPIARGPAIEVGGLVSPDGRLIAYSSDEPGSLEIFVQAYPEGGTKQQVSSGGTGGTPQAWWERDGRHLLYLRRDQTLWRVSIESTGTGTPLVGTPQQIGTFPLSLIAMDLDVTHDRFLALTPEHAGTTTIAILQSWRTAVAAGR
jgi:hypothetical protein